MSELLAVGAGGFIGSCLRFALNLCLSLLGVLGGIAAAKAVFRKVRG